MVTGGRHRSSTELGTSSFVDAAHRGRGLGTFLVKAATGHPDVTGIRQVLMAEPGRSIYRRLGFDVLASPDRWMERPTGYPLS